MSPNFVDCQLSLIINDVCNLSETAYCIFLFLGVVKYSKLCESMTILAPVHLRGIQINGGDFSLKM